MLNENENIIIDSYYCGVVKDDYARGEVGGSVAWWTNGDIKVENNKSKTVFEALEKVCVANGFKFNKDNWINWGKEIGSNEPNDLNRFDGDVMVDKYSCEASESDMKKWREQKLDLYNCHIVVHLKIASERDLGCDEIDGLFSLDN